MVAVERLSLEAAHALVVLFASLCRGPLQQCACGKDGVCFMTLLFADVMSSFDAKKPESLIHSNAKCDFGTLFGDSSGV